MRTPVTGPILRQFTLLLARQFTNDVGRDAAGVPTCAMDQTPSREELTETVRALREEVDRLKEEIRRLRRELHQAPPHYL